ncbi:MAG: hypothetical protein AMJ67_17605 [Betaproteobacteria bacterium SG8_41]|nr:MAG: hypothetical protein AMJ67_17605 [Betaproteobacteria bacterium SG8_41]
MREAASSRRAGRPAERALLVQLRLDGRNVDEDAEELRLLALSAGADVRGTIFGSRQIPDAATFVGKGKAEEIREAVAREQTDLIVVNHELSPAQERNLEKLVGCRVLDRTGLILDIFAQRARSHEGKLQVELAQLEHLATRLVRGWTHLERQKGGIGLRGPGETQLEVDRRLIRDRIKKLHERLFNHLTGAGVYAADQLFATLDPTMRRLELSGNANIILTDTVGFVRHLPHDLVEAFKSTLEEVAEANLLLHVVDASSSERIEQMQQVNIVLTEIAASEIPQIVIFNKIDLSGEAPHSERDAAGRIARIWLSARTGQGVELLRDALSEHYRRTRQLLRLHLPPAAGRLRALLYERFDVRGEEQIESGGWRIDVELDAAKLEWLQRQAEFDPSFIVQEKPRVLAPTGSCP